MRRALVIGIDGYLKSPLNGCVNDAEAMEELLAHNEDGSPNFSCRKIISPVASGIAVTRGIIKDHVTELFSHEADVALLHFSGHGTVNNLGGYLVTTDAAKYDEGLSMVDVLTLANGSKAREVVIILDCCHSGALGSLPAIDNDKAILREGVSVLTASRSSQLSQETPNDRGLFTSHVCSALKGGAADVIGNVTVASVYAYVDQVLGAWEQRPLFKSHVSRLIPLRRCKPEVPLELLRLLPQYFTAATTEFQLDPSFEPLADPKHSENETIFGHLQKFRAARLLAPVGEEHMYFAAMNSKTCKLTELGAFYWMLANEGKI